MGGGQSREGEFRWIDRYELIDIDNNDRLLKLMSRVGESEYIGKEVTSQGADIQAMERLIDSKIVSPSPFLMRLRRAAVKREEGLCSASRTFYLVFEKPFQSLREESIARRIKGGRFSEEEAECILESCVRGIHCLKEMGQAHRSISTSSIFLREDRTVLLGDPWVAAQGALSSTLYGCAYPSPEKILFQNQLIHAYDHVLSDLFSLGVVLLEVLTLEHMDTLYEKGFRRLRHTQVAERIRGVGREELRERLRVLLDCSPARRGEIFRMCSEKEGLQSRFILQEKEKFKSNYITTQLETSQVRTVKPRDEANTIINNINESRNHSDFSMLTEPKNHSQRVHTFAFNELALRGNHNPRQHVSIYQHPQPHPQPQIIYPQQVRLNNSVQQQYIPRSNEISPRVFPNTSLPFVIEMSKQQPQPHALSSSINQQQHHVPPSIQTIPSQPLTTLPQQALQDRMELSSIQQNSSRGSEDISNLEMLGEERKEQPTIKEMECYQVQNKGDIVMGQGSHHSRQLNSTIKQLSDQSPSKEELEESQQDVVYEMGTRYKGQMRKGLREGKGTFYYVDGGYYEGEWRQNKMHGKGRLYYPNSRLTYEGSWHMDCFHGQGTLYNYEPLVLEGPYDYSNLERIEQYWQKYEGEFFYDKKHGRGKLTLTNGQVYSGMFESEEVSGEGKYLRMNGEVVHGIWGRGILLQRL